MAGSKVGQGKAVVFAAGGDSAIAQAITDGVVSARLSRQVKKVQKENAELQNTVDFWKYIANLRKLQVFENSIQRIREDEERHSPLYLNSKACLFVGFALGIMFCVLMTALAILLGGL